MGMRICDECGGRGNSMLDNPCKVCLGKGRTDECDWTKTNRYGMYSLPFRVWHNEKKMMYYGPFVVDYTKHKVKLGRTWYSWDYNRKKNHSVVSLQAGTGILDRLGHNIWEGDIVLISCNNDAWYGSICFVPYSIYCYQMPSGDRAPWPHVGVYDCFLVNDMVGNWSSVPLGNISILEYKEGVPMLAGIEVVGHRKDGRNWDSWYDDNELEKRRHEATHWRGCGEEIYFYKGD